MNNIKFQKEYLLIIPVAIIAIIIIYILKKDPKIDPNNPPKFIQANFIDLSKIYSISKFRSSAGHDFSGGDETCRSMKHYFVPQRDSNSLKQNQLPPAPTGSSDDIAIYSPVDGNITQIAAEQTPVGTQIYITPDNQPQFIVRLFHVYTIDGITTNSHIKAGQQIGWISNLSDTDISVQIGGAERQGDAQFISYFSVMPDSLFSDYQKRGLTSRSEIVISKEYRNSHPFECTKDNSQAFIRPTNFSEMDDYVTLSGYIKPVYQGNNQKNNNNN